MSDNTSKDKDLANEIKGAWWMVKYGGLGAVVCAAALVLLPSIPESSPFRGLALTLASGAGFFVVAFGVCLIVAVVGVPTLGWNLLCYGACRTVRAIRAEPHGVPAKTGMADATRLGEGVHLISHSPEQQSNALPTGSRADGLTATTVVRQTTEEAVVTAHSSQRVTHHSNEVQSPADAIKVGSKMLFVGLGGAVLVLVGTTLGSVPDSSTFYEIAQALRVELSSTSFWTGILACSLLIAGLGGITLTIGCAWWTLARVLGWLVWRFKIDWRRYLDTPENDRPPDL